jgi:hypothetical protein
LATNLVESTGYYVTIDAGAFKDRATPPNAYAGITATNSWHFITADLTPPSLISTWPTNHATGVASGSNLILVFSEVVKAGTGRILVRRKSDGSTLHTLTATSNAVAVSGTQVTLDPPFDLATGELYVLIESNAIKDLEDNAYAGLTSDNGWVFAIQGKVDGYASPRGLPQNTLIPRGVTLARFTGLEVGDALHIHTAAGRKVAEVAASASLAEWALPDTLTPGVYLVMVVNQGRKIQTVKIVVLR